MSDISDLMYEAMRIDEMAISKSDISKKTAGFSKTIVEHVLKSIALGNSTWNLEHWETEIAEHLRKIDSLTWGGDKKLKETEYNTQLKSYYNSSLQSLLEVSNKLVKLINQEYNTNIICTRELVDLLYEALEEIFDKSCKILSTKGSRDRKIFLDIVKESIESKTDIL